MRNQDLFQKLESLGIEKVTVYFSGFSDGGMIDDIIIHNENRDICGDEIDRNLSLVLENLFCGYVFYNTDWFKRPIDATIEVDVKERSIEERSDTGAPLSY